jgi:hypothetical protein
MNHKLNFVAVGPFKTGTSWMYNYLQYHPQVCLPRVVKETFFFDKKYSQGLDWYFSHFGKLDERKLIGEVAPSYFHSVEATERIYRLNPQCKIIVSLREPISRLVSFYLHMLQRGELAPKTSFIEALEQRISLVNTSLYYHHLSRWINLFGREQVNIVFYESLKNFPQKFAEELCTELSIQSILIPEQLNSKVNERQAPVNHTLSKITYRITKLLHDKGLHKIVDYGKNIGIKKIIFKKESVDFKLTEQEKKYAISLIEKDIKELKNSLGIDLSCWQGDW